MKTNIRSKVTKILLLSAIIFGLLSANTVGAFTVIAGSYASYCKQVAPYTWFTRISTTSVASGDDVGVWYTLPWYFPYYGESKSRVYICSNGFLIFDPTPATNDYSNTVEELRDRWMIAPFWDDLCTDVSGGIVSTPGVYVDYIANCIVITWEATRFGAPADSIKFQVVLAWNGIIRIAINGATNFANFSPTLGVSKGTNIDFIDITGERATQKTWDLHYDCGCFYYERDGAWPYVPNFMCLTSSGYVNHGYCYCGPPNSRNYAPDYLRWDFDYSSYFGADLRFTQNLYSSAQSWSGKDFCFVVESMLPTAHGTIDEVWSNLPDVVINSATRETWAGIEVWEADAHTLTPQNMQAGTTYYVDIWVSMNGGYYVGNSIAQEYELYDDRFPWYPLASNCGMQIDHFKAYLGSYWYSYTDRSGCDSPREIIQNTTFPGGAFAVRKTVEQNIVDITTCADLHTYENLVDYISSRMKATNELLATVDPTQFIPVRVTFATPINPQEYIDLVEKMGMEVLSYNAMGTNGCYGSINVASKQISYNWESETRLQTTRDVDVLGVTGFVGFIPAKNIKSLQNDPKVLLVDPWEDLTIKQLKQSYLEQGFEVNILPTEDLWPKYNSSKSTW